MDQLIAALKAFFPEHLHPSIFMVGGMVRDVLLGVECQDVDLAAAVPVPELTALGFRLVESKSTPNIYFRFKEPFGKIEVTWLPTLDALPADLSRRDFTVNAMAMSLEGRLSDPLGGQADLERRILRCCSPSSLADDPLRILRAFRFECEGWRLDAEAEAILKSREWSAELQRIPVERFSQEMLKAIAKEDPSRFFRRMVEFGIGDNFLPEIFSMAEITAGPPKHHPEGDLLTHSLQVLERMAQLTPDPTARFCALFHDLGKLYTPPELHPKHHGHDALGAEKVPAFCKRLRLPVSLQRALQATNRLHNNANRWEELRDATKIKLAQAALKAGIQDFLPLQVAADFHASMPGWDQVLRVASMNAAELGLDDSLLNIKDIPPDKLQQIIMQRRVQVLAGQRRATSG